MARSAANHGRQNAKKLEAKFAGIDSIPRLFAYCFEAALVGVKPDRGALDGAGLAKLQRIAETNLQLPVGLLHWVEPAVLRALEMLFSGLAVRDGGEAYRFRDAERRRLAEILGDDGRADPRQLFVVAHLIDRCFPGYPSDFARLGMRATRVVPAPDKFLDATIRNPVPPIGQMTPIAVLRRWMRHFWWVGSTTGLTGLGPTPQLRAASAGTRGGQTRQRLKQAATEGVLRLATVSWRRHTNADLKEHRPSPGLFAIHGVKSRVDAVSLIDGFLDVAAKHQVHIVLLPELAMDDAEFGALRVRLHARARKFPCLVAVGRTHQAGTTGPAHVSEAVLLDSAGEVLLRHEKIEPYSYEDPSGSGVRWMEDIVPRESREYGYLDTPVGRIVLNICKDFGSDVPMLLNRVLAANLILIANHSPRLDFVAGEARSLGARQHSIVLAANPSNPDLVHEAFLYAPIRGEACSQRLIAQETPAVGGAFRVLLFDVSAGPGQEAAISVEAA